MPIYAFVSAPVDSPTVILNLDDQTPLTVVEGAKTSPPQRRVSSFGSSARDGDVLAQKAYQDRQITIPLRFELGSTAEEQSETLQALGRILDGESWLQWQHDGKIEPVFYRVKFGDIDIDDSIADETPDRDVTLNLVAEPFGEGVPVTGSATITNSPTAATNPMSYVFPDIQGDVETELWLEWKYNTTTGNHHTRAVVASSAGDVTPSTPTYLILNTTSAVPAAGWASADQADATFINGTRRRSTKSSGTAMTTVASTATVSFVPGNYRVLFRGTAPAGATLELAKSGGTAVLSYTVPATSPGELTWYDLGVARMPFDQPLLDSARGLVASLPSSFNFQVGLSTGTGVIDADALLFIPAGLDEALRASYATVAPPYALSGFDYYGTLDGINSLAYSKADLGSGDRNTGVMAVAGGFPSLTPGVKNVLHLLPYLFAGELDGEPDSKSKTTVIDWIYRPKYLYDRPASS